MTWTKIFSFWLWGGLQNWSRGGFGFGFGVGFDSKVGVGSDSAWSGLQFGRRDWFLIPALGWAYNFLKYFGFWFNCCRFVIFYGWYRVGKYRAGTVFPERKFVVDCYYYLTLKETFFSRRPRYVLCFAVLQLALRLLSQSPGGSVP